MKLQLRPTAAAEDAPSPLAMRTQRHGRVVAILDGDAHLHVWEPNRGADALDIDLSASTAIVIHAGIDAPPAPQPHWTDEPGTTTVIISLDAGANGAIMIDGHRVSEAAAVQLAADGFTSLLRAWTAERLEPDADGLDEPPASDEPVAPDPGGPD